MTKFNYEDKICSLEKLINQNECYCNTIYRILENVKIAIMWYLAKYCDNFIPWGVK